MLPFVACDNLKMGNLEHKDLSFFKPTDECFCRDDPSAVLNVMQQVMKCLDGILIRNSKLFTFYV